MLRPPQTQTKTTTIRIILAEPRAREDSGSEPFAMLLSTTQNVIFGDQQHDSAGTFESHSAIDSQHDDGATTTSNPLRCAAPKEITTIDDDKLSQTGSDPALTA